jgi:hypothetical protein
MAWLLVSGGLTAAACGLVLVGWSLLAGRGDLWNPGVASTLLGQFALVAGRLIQFGRRNSDLGRPGVNAYAARSSHASLADHQQPLR